MHDKRTEESSEELLAQESIRPKANAKIVGKKSNFSFFIEPHLERSAHTRFGVCV